MEKELSKLDVLYSVATMDERIHGYTRITVEKAMTEYATQQSKKEAILFAEWKEELFTYSYSIHGNKWCNRKTNKYYTTEEVYQLFKDNL